MSKNEYYKKKLAGSKLKQVYELATPRIQQYCEAEINFLRSRITELKPKVILELGCGYGRVLKALEDPEITLWGIDSSQASILDGREFLAECENTFLVVANACNTGLADNSFDLTFAIQNGISAFRTEPKKIVSEAIRITQPGGLVLFSSYSSKIWSARLEWFELQSQAGLLGEIDKTKTGNGEIVCTDGFRATTFSESMFRKICTDCGCSRRITEIDQSSLFCEISVD